MQTISKPSPWQQACAILGTDPAIWKKMEEKADVIYRASCKILRIQHDAFPDLFAINDEYHASLIAGYKLEVIVKALNGDWQQDWNDWSQKKWAPYFRLDNPGFRFVDAYCDLVHTSVTGGPRLALRSRGRAEFVGRYCITLFRDLMGAGELAPEALSMAA